MKMLPSSSPQSNPQHEQLILAFSCSVLKLEAVIFINTVHQLCVQRESDMFVQSVFSLFHYRSLSGAVQSQKSSSLNLATSRTRKSKKKKTKKLKKGPKSRKGGFNMPEQQRHTIRKMNIRLVSLSLSLSAFRPNSVRPSLIWLDPVCSMRKCQNMRDRSVCVCVWSPKKHINI